MARRPLRARVGRNTSYVEGPHEGIPDWLRGSLVQWVEEAADVTGITTAMLERKLRARLPWSTGGTPSARERASLWLSDQNAFDVIDLILAELWAQAKKAGSDYLDDDRYREKFVDVFGDLVAILNDAGSEWMVGVDADGVPELQLRVDETTRAASAATIASADRAGDYLARAWSLTYGRHPDPTAAYNEAIKAVEAAAKPIVTPTDNVTTLGKILQALRDKPSKWNLPFRPADDRPMPMEVVRQMAELLWRSHHDRHGDDAVDKPLSVTQAEAEAAVHLAVLLVHWFSSSIERTDT